MTLETHRTRTATWIAHGCCAALLVTGVATRAVAADATPGTLTRKVSFAGLNLNRQADVELLYRRIAGAASQVCDPVHVSPDLQSKFRVRHCVEDSIARAVAEIHAPALTRYYAQRMQQMAAPAASEAFSDAR